MPVTYSQENNVERNQPSNDLDIDTVYILRKLFMYGQKL